MDCVSSWGYAVGEAFQVFFPSSCYTLVAPQIFLVQVDVCAKISVHERSCGDIPPPFWHLLNLSWNLKLNVKEFRLYFEWEMYRNIFDLAKLMFVIDYLSAAGKSQWNMKINIKSLYGSVVIWI